MEPQNIFADHMQVGGPAPLLHQIQIGWVIGVQQGGKIAKQGIEPHIKRMTPMAWNGDSPGKINPRNRKILKTSSHKVHHLPLS